MKSLTLLIFSFLCAQIFCYTKLEKLSINGSLSILELIDNIKATNDSNLKIEFSLITDYEYSDEIVPLVKAKIYEVINQNIENTSFFMKVTGLITFKNIITVLMVIVCIAFIFSLFGEIIMLLTAFMGLVILKLLFNKKTLYVFGILLSGITLYFKYDKIENRLIKHLFIFDWLTPLFGCLLFGIISFMIYDDIIKNILLNEYNSKRSYIEIGSFVTVIWGSMSIYHDNWVLGIITIVMLFFTSGFLFGSMFMGYYIGFDKDNSIIRCLFTSIILNSIFILIKIGFIQGNIILYISVFEAGVYFWGSIVGCTALLILSDELYISYRYKQNITLFVILQLCMALYCLGMMYVGSLLYISSYKNIGGTFLVLFCLNLERTILQKFRSGAMTLLLLIILINLYIIKQLITLYPEYSLI